FGPGYGLPALVGGDEAAGAVRAHGAREEEALAELAAELLEERQLRAGLDALGEHLLVERLAELEDGAHDLAAVALARHAVDERAVDLERIDGQRRQVAQRRIAGAEVVDGKRDAHVMQRREGRDGVLAAVHDAALGYF